MKQRKSTGRPMCVTRNGETEAVVLSPAGFDALTDQAELVRSLKLLDRSMGDVKAGMGQPLKQAILDVAKELGLKLSR